MWCSVRLSVFKFLFHFIPDKVHYGRKWAIMYPLGCNMEAFFRVFSVFLGTGNYRLATGAQHLPGRAATLRLSFVYARRFIVEIELVR